MTRAAKLVLVMAFMLGASPAQVQAQASRAGPAATPEPPRTVVTTSRPPPTIADLVLLLQSYKPDPERIARLRAEMEEAVPTGDDPDVLAIAWHKKALAAGELQEPERRGEFLEKAVDHARRATAANPSGLGSYARVRTEYAASLWWTRGVTAALDSFAEFIAENANGPPNGFLIHAHCEMTHYHLHLGDIERARASLATAEAIFK